MFQPIDPLHHRSKNETKKWLRTRDWYDKYINNLKVEYTNIYQRRKFLLGDMEVSTISAAFCYSETPEGSEYWIKIEETFLKWYYYQD